MGNEVIPDVPRDEDIWPPEHVLRRKRTMAKALDITDRLYDVLELVVAGHTNAEIGRKLFLSEETIKSHVKSLLALLEANNRAHLVANAFRRDLVI